MNHIVKANRINDLRVRAADVDLTVDPRWQLTQRIVSSPCFQKAERLRSLLTYVVEESLRGNAAQLTEQHIGQAVFGKPAGYSPSEDSSVRANARLLRLRLHEYYDLYGRAEPLVLTLPKGTYVPVFEPGAAALPDPEAASTPAPPPAPMPPPAAPSTRGRRWIWLACGLAGLLAGYFAGRLRPAAPAADLAPWPLSEVFASSAQTQIVISDINYGLLSILGGRLLKLDEYIGPGYPGNMQPPAVTPREKELASHLSRTSYVSYADARMTQRLIEAAGTARSGILIRSARDLKTRELSDGNFLFLGSPSSNLWVSLFEDRLNFVERKSPGEAAYFENRKPAEGEQARYAGIPKTGSSGVEYASIALLPGQAQRGNVLILQGAQQEGTEAAGMLLATEQGRRRLRAALALPPEGEVRNVYFEALIRSRVVGGAAALTEVVATRRLR